MQIQTVIFFLLFIVSSGYCTIEVFWHYRVAKLGRAEYRGDRGLERLKLVLERVLLHSKIRNFPFFATFHLFIMWGFIILFFSSLDMAALGLFQQQVPLFGTNAIFLLFRDTFIVLVTAGVVGCTMRRRINRPEWLNNSNMAYVILWLIFFIVLSELMYFSALVALGEFLPKTAWLVHVIAGIFTAFSRQAILIVMVVSWWLHFLLIFSFFILIPGSKHLHIFFAVPNIYWRSLKSKGALLPAQIEGNPAGFYGAVHFLDFTWKQLFDSVSCVKCGRCNGECPSRKSGELVKPKKINGRLRKYLENDGRELLKYYRGNIKGKLVSNDAKTARNTVQMNKPKILTKKLVGDIFETEAIWNCTTCGACVEACPVSIDHISKIIDMRRGLVSGKGDIPPEFKLSFAGVEQKGNPYGKERTPGMLANELGLPTLRERPDAEYLFFVGCAATYHESARKTAIAFAKILKTAGVAAAILDEEEWCCGETIRRMGNEKLFQETVKRNIAVFMKMGVRRIITSCPHCFNTLQNEYPQFGGIYEVIPHTAFLSGLLKQGIIHPSGEHPLRVTYHDPCYLGRYNGYFQEAREIIKCIPGVQLKEMIHLKEKSFCCGGGGGRYWIEGGMKNAISKKRTREALETGAEIIVTACPYCHELLQPESSDTKQYRPAVTMDIAELLEFCEIRVECPNPIRFP